MQKYTKPPDVPDSLWNQAQALNPDRSRLASKTTTRCLLRLTLFILSTLRLVPVVARGFDDLKKRVEQQDAVIKEHKEKLQQIQKLIASMLNKHHITTTTTIESYKRRNLELAGRTVRVSALPSYLPQCDALMANDFVFCTPQVMRKLETLRALGHPSTPEEVSLL